MPTGGQRGQNGILIAVIRSLALSCGILGDDWILAPILHCVI